MGGAKPRLRLASEITCCIYVDLERVLSPHQDTYDEHVLVVDPLSVLSDGHVLVRRVTVKSSLLFIFKHICHIEHQSSILCKFFFCNWVA